MCPAAATATTAPAVESYGDKNKPGGLGNIVGAPLLRPRKLGVTDEVNLSASGTKEPKSSGVIPVSFRESKKVTMSVPGPWYHYYVESVVYMISGVAVVWIMHKLLRASTRWRGSPEEYRHLNPILTVPEHPEAPRHHWTSDVPLPLHCSICRAIIMSTGGGVAVEGRPPEPGHTGLVCTDCGLASCDLSRCLKTANRLHQCKAVSLAQQLKNPEDKSCRKKMRHHWVKGDHLPTSSDCCYVCDEVCHDDGSSEGIDDLRCCWCQRTVHNICQASMSDLCDLGDFRRFIVPPLNVTAKASRTVMHPRRWTISKVTTPADIPNWTPLIVIGNKKAGNNDGEAFLNAFRAQLNPAQVLDLATAHVEDGLHWCELIQKVRCIVLVAGGDGTVGWVLNTIEALNLSEKPVVALLPLGTGNDLARTLGYGPGGETHHVREILETLLSNTSEVELDRWVVSITKLPLGKKLPKVTKEIFIQNYLSIGVDALVTYNFHQTRENKRIPFSGRLFNKILYFIYGTKDVLERECKDLDRILELELDGRKVSLPNVESIVILNIPCWGAGVRPWQLGAGHRDFPAPKYNDGKLEVMCVYSSFHIAQMQVGLSEPHRIGQASRVSITLRGTAPIQTDGEPWLQGPAKIVIEHYNKVSFLAVGK